MRFNDYHKFICAILQLDPDIGRRFRTFCVRCYSRGLTMNACVALLRQEPDIKTLLAERAKIAAAQAQP